MSDFPCNSEIRSVERKVKEAAHVVILDLEGIVLFRFRGQFFQDFGGFSQTILEDEIVAISHFKGFKFQTNNRSDQEADVTFLELHVSDSRLALVGKLMCAAGIVREIFKSTRVHSVKFNKTCEFFNCWKVKMQEGKVPYSPIEEPSLTQNGQYLIVELLIFEHPKDLLRSEDVRVKDVSIGKEGNDLFLLA